MVYDPSRIVVGPFAEQNVQAGRPVVARHDRLLAQRTEALWIQGTGGRKVYSAITPDNAPTASTTTLDGTFSTFEIDTANNIDFQLPWIVTKGFDRLRCTAILALKTPSLRTETRVRLHHPITTGATTVTGETKWVTSASDPRFLRQGLWHQDTEIWSFHTVNMVIDQDVSGAAASTTAFLDFQIAFTIVNNVWGSFSGGGARSYTAKIHTLRLEEIHEGAPL